jgi:glycosyltransferase involved in cell wall biosynthesis
VGDAVVKSDHLDRARLVKIYNGVDTESFRPPTDAEAAAARAKFGLKDSDFVVGMVAGFRPEKNHRMLFEGALAALPQIPGMKILAVGAGPLIEEFRSRYSGTMAVFAGDTRDVTTALWAMDVGTLLPSMNEGFSNAVIEKMGAGLPMIVTDVGGNAEAVFEGENGYVIPPHDAGRFTAALIELHADADRRRAMGRRSRALVEHRFSLPQMCATHVALYRSLCASGATAPVPARG